MRTSAPLIATLAISVFLAGCGEQETSVEETKEEAGIEETTTEETNNRAETTVEETIATTAEVAFSENGSEPAKGTVGSQEEEPMNASLEGAAREQDQGQVEEGISVVQTAAPDPATVGRPLTFTIVVTNNSFPQHVGFKDFLPPSVTLVSATPSQGYCGTLHHGGNLFDCTLGTIPNGGSVAVEVVATPTAPGNITNIAQAGGGFAPVESVPATVTVYEPVGFTLRLSPDGSQEVLLKGL